MRHPLIRTLVAFAAGALCGTVGAAAALGALGLGFGLSLALAPSERPEVEILAR